MQMQSNMPQKPNEPQQIPKHEPKQETIIRPGLIDFKKKVDGMSDKDQLKNLLEDNEEWLRMELSNEPEVDNIQ